MTKCGVATASFQIRQWWGVLIPTWWTPRFLSNNFQRTTSSFGESGEKKKREDEEKATQEAISVYSEFTRRC